MHFVRKYLFRLLLLLLSSLLLIIICYPGCLSPRQRRSQIRKEDHGLPFLPELSMFVRTETLLPPNEKMCELINYVCQPWIEHPFVSVVIDWGLFDTVPFSLPPVPDFEIIGGFWGDFLLLLCCCF